MGINVGITVTVVVILLAILAFFIFQNRRFRQRLLQLRESPSRQEGTKTAGQRASGNPPEELDITRYELTEKNASSHELSGNEIHELYHRGNQEHGPSKDCSLR